MILRGTFSGNWTVLPLLHVYILKFMSPVAAIGCPWIESKHGNRRTAHISSELNYVKSPTPIRTIEGVSKYALHSTVENLLFYSALLFLTFSVFVFWKFHLVLQMETSTLHKCISSIRLEGFSRPIFYITLQFLFPTDCEMTHFFLMLFSNDCFI